MKFPSWHVAPENCAASSRLMDAGYPYLVSGVLASRGVDTAETAAEFLAQETSLTSALVGKGLWIMESSICVAVMTGFPYFLQV